MKFILRLATALLLTQTAFAQNNTDGWVLGGDFGFTSAGDSRFLTLSPELGYRYENGFEVGFGTGFTMIKSGDIRNNLWNFGPYINYQIAESFFIRGRYQYLSGETTAPSLPSLRIHESSLWLGGGYQSINNGVIYRAGVLYNALYKENSSVYSSPFLPYVSFGLNL